MKGQSNPEIARTPRNVFRYSVAKWVKEVELPIGLGGLTAYQPLTNSECLDAAAAVRPRVRRSGAERGTTQTTGQGPQVRAKLTERGGDALTARMLAWKQPSIQRVRNSSLVERPCAENKRASSPPPKPWALRERGGRGALRQQRRCPARGAGAAAKANVGMSNDNAGGKPARRKTKGSSFNGNQNRVSRDLRISRKAMPMASR